MIVRATEGGAAQPLDGGHGPVEMRDFAACLGKDHLAQRGQSGFAAAFKQRRTDVILELLEHHRDRGWCAAERLRRVGEASVFGHCPETAQHFDLDCQVQPT
jgi:hypothetical protein